LVKKNGLFYLVKGRETGGKTSKLLGHPTPFFAHELNTVSTIKKAKTLAIEFN